MNIISYRYTNSMKQLLVLAIMLYFLLRFAIMVEIAIFDIPGYEVNMILTVLLYAVIFAVLIAIFLGHKFCYTLYDDDTLTYYNRLLRKDKSIELADVNKAVFGKKGVHFYKEGSDSAVFYIPFFRGGIIDALEINNFYASMKKREDIHVVKEFKVLPGYGKPYMALKVAHLFLAMLIFLNCFTPFATVIILYQNFM